MKEKNNFIIETTEARIKKQEISKEETEEEIQALKETLKKVNELTDITRGIARDELQAFSKRLKQQIEINEDILEEIIQGIDFIKGL